MANDGQPEELSPRERISAAHSAPRCGARRKYDGEPCQSPAMPNGRCRMHGGASPGAPKGNKNAWKHGRRSAAAMARRKEVRELIRTLERLGWGEDDVGGE